MSINQKLDIIVNAALACLLDLDCQYARETESEGWEELENATIFNVCEQSREAIKQDCIKLCAAAWIWVLALSTTYPVSCLRVKTVQGTS